MPFIFIINLISHESLYDIIPIILKTFYIFIEGAPDMKINIIYESKFGNGKKMLEKLARLLRDKNQEVELFRFTETDPGSLPRADLYIFHSPTRQFMLPLGVRSFTRKFTPPAEKTKYALSTTYMDPRTIALKKMDDYLQKKGMLKVTEDLKIEARGLQGPLEDYEGKINDFTDRVTGS